MAPAQAVKGAHRLSGPASDLDDRGRHSWDAGDRDVFGGILKPDPIGAGVGPVLAWHPACVVSRRIKERDPRRSVRARPEPLQTGLPEF